MDPVEDQHRGEPAQRGRAEACTPVMKADLVQSSVTSITCLGGSKYAKTRMIQRGLAWSLGKAFTMKKNKLTHFTVHIVFDGGMQTHFCVDIVMCLCC